MGIVSFCTAADKHLQSALFSSYFKYFPCVYAQVTQAHSERSAYNNLLIFAYFISQQNIRVCMENATKTL